MKAYEYGAENERTFAMRCLCRPARLRGDLRDRETARLLREAGCRACDETGCLCGPC